MDGPDRGSLRLPLLLTLVVYALLAAVLDFVCDDAYISFRYSRHLAEGHGLVYNLGRVPPVEGYSNFLWVLWLAPFEGLGVDPALAARLSSFVAGACLIVAVMRHARARLGLSRRATFATGLFLATLPPMALWASSGLAAMPTALFVFLGHERLFGDPRAPRPLAAGLWLLAAALVRADGAVWAVLLYLAGGLHWILYLRDRRLPLAALVAGLVLTAGVGLHVAWRLSTYGDWLPNTARVKAGFSPERIGRGVDYLVSWLLLLPGVVLVLVCCLRRWSGEAGRLVGLAAVVLGGTGAYAVWVGGDFMPFGRFLLPAVPFVALAFAACLARLGPPRASLLAGTCVALGAFACFDVNLAPRGLREAFHFRRDRAFQSELERRAEMDTNTRRWLLLGRALAAHTRPGESMILGGIGAVGYLTELFLYDTYGLVTPEVIERGEVVAGASPGHDRRVQPDAFFQDRPTYLGAFLAAPGVDEAERPWWAERLPGGWERHPWRQLVDELRIPLPQDQGFPPGCELVLLRFRWAE